MPAASDSAVADLLARLMTVPFMVLVALALTLLRLFLLSRKVTLYPGEPKQINPTARSLADVVGVLLGLFVLVFLLPRPFTPQLFSIPSESMEPTLLGHEPGQDPITGVVHTDSVHDHILVNKMLYRLGDPQRGDIIVFKAPPEADGEARMLGQEPKENTLTQRIIGLPGDTIWVKEGAVFRKEAGKKEFAKLVEPYLDPKLPLDNPQREDAMFATHEPLTLGPDQYFVMGDNRNDSNDSRFWGTLERRRIIGKVTYIYAPPERRRALP